jgi:dipeptidyl-peptidase-4
MQQALFDPVYKENLLTQSTLSAASIGSVVFAALIVSIGNVGHAQQAKIYTYADYARAESMLSYNVDSLAMKGVVRPHWMEDGRFWYRAVDESGATYRVVDPVKKTNGAAFDQVKLAAALSAVSGGKEFDAMHLRIGEFNYAGSNAKLHVTVGGSEFDCTLSGRGDCKAVERKQEPEEPMTMSPDGKKGAFIRDWNLWVHDIATGKDTQMTTDGVKDFGYATDNAGWKHTDAAIMLWSPDSKEIATFQQDQRKDGEMYLVSTNNGHPELKAWKYPMVGDEHVTMIERVVIDVETGKMVRLKMPPDQHRSTICDDVACVGTKWDDVEWSPNDAHLAFVSTSRDHKQEWLRVADTKTGDVREVFTETAPKFFESGADMVNWHYLPGSNEFLWYSERSNWGQMYLYDLTTGKLKNQITTGDGNVTKVLHVDRKARTIYYLAVGKEKGRDPYFEHLYSIKFDGSGMKLLTPEDADHQVTFSDDLNYFVDSYSTVVKPRVAVLRSSATGELALELGRQDISKLLATGWVPPTPIVVKARDGKTDLYGFMFKPTDFDASKKYPIVNHVYPGPQVGSCGSRSFMAAHGDDQGLAELGFIVVCIDGMGTNLRSKSFHEAYYGDMGDNTIPDQVSGMKDLAARYSWIDIDRAGIYGHSGGGNATAAAMFHYPDFFKVGIAESGNHDERDYEDDWAEKWAGLVVTKPDGTSNYDSQANQNDAKDLKGHLLLAHGTMDDNVPPNNTLLVVAALIKANKDFDLLMIPNKRHGYGDATLYVTRRRWDYFVRYLAGATPPKEYQMKSYAAALSALSGGPEDGDE